MKCSICSNACSYGAMCITIFLDQMDTINLCTRCRLQLLGDEADQRVRRAVRLTGWVQPQLPHL